MVPTRTPDGTAHLASEMKKLRSTVDMSTRTFKRGQQIRRSLAMSFLMGVASALGALATVVIITPLIGLFLQNVAWPPLIADLVAKVIIQYEQVNRQSPQAADGQ